MRCLSPAANTLPRLRNTAFGIVQRWTSAYTTTELTTFRSDIASAALDLAVENPLGFGAGNFGEALAMRVREGLFTIVDTHNDYLRVLLEGGFLSNPHEAGKIESAAFRQKLDINQRSPRKSVMRRKESVRFRAAVR